MGQALRSSDFLPNPSDLADEVELYKKILDAIADMVLCKGPKSRIVWANKAFCEYYGMSNQELKDIIDAPFNEPDFTQQYIKDDHYVFTTGKTLEIEEPVTRHDGIVRLFSTVKSAVLDRNGHVRMTVGVCRDITEVKQEQEELDLYRKQLEEVVRARTKELSELSESLRVTLHGITDGVISVNAEGNIRIINQSALGMLGRSQEEILGRNIAEVLALVDEHSGAPVSLLKSDEGSKLRIARLRRADAHDLLVEYHTASLNWADGSAPGMVLLFRDVTISKQLEARLLQQQKLDSVALLAGGIAHDFNNFLQSILGNITLAQLCAEGNPKLSEILGRAERACSRAQSVTGQLLAFSKGGKPNRRPNFLRPIIEEAATLAVRGSNVRIMFDFPVDLWSASVDEGQIGQVVSNLVINAQQAMPNGGAIEISAVNIESPVLYGFPSDEGRGVLVKVRDTGCGIAPENLNRIFDPYFTTKSTGSGLGLASVHAIVRNHGGHVLARSEIGKGTEISVMLPACHEEALALSKSSLELVRGNQERVLVMDDDVFIRQNLMAMLERLNFCATCCSNADEAVDYFRRAIESNLPFDCVILDLTIPGGRGGDAVIGELKKLDPHIRSLVSSGYSAGVSWDAIKLLGFTAILPKPYTFAQLSHAMAEVLPKANHASK